MIALHPEWTTLVAENPDISHDADERNMGFFSNPANDELVSRVSTKDTTVPARDNHLIPIRLYTAKTTPASRGVVVFFHSGGFISGSLETEDISCRYMALGGPFTIISVEYRLSPDHLFPVPINDGWDAFEYIVSHLPDLVPNAIRSLNLVLSGTSSGGQLAAMVSQRARDWLQGETVKLAGVLLRAPVTVRGVETESIPRRFRDAHGSWCAELETVRLDRAGMKEIHDALGVPQDMIRTADAYPLWGTLEGLPRTYIQLCEADILRDDGVCYAQGLREAGVEVRETLYKGLPHIFWVYGPELQVSKKAQDDAVSGLRWLMGVEA